MTPSFISRKLALRIWSACAHQQSRILHGLTGDQAGNRAHRRAGDAGREAFERKKEARLRLAVSLEATGDTLARWARDWNAPSGGDVPADLVGLGCAVIFGDGHAAEQIIAQCSEAGCRRSPPSQAHLEPFLEYALDAICGRGRV